MADGEGTIKVFGTIGSYVDAEGNFQPGISSDSFCNELDYLAQNCQVINILINSTGGDVFQGYSMFAAIRDCKVKTVANIVGAAYSAAGWIAMACDKCVMQNYSALMIHGAFNPDSNEKDELLDVINGSIAQMISNRTGMKKEECDALMKTETFYRAFDKEESKILLKKKMVDEIVVDSKFSAPKNATPKELVSIYNSYNEKPKNTMSKINNLLKLRNEASEDAQVEAIDKLNADISAKDAELATLKTELEALKAKVTESENQEKEAINNEATEVVNSLVKAGVYTKEEAPNMILNASQSRSNLDFIKKTAEKLVKNRSVKIFNNADLKVNDATYDGAYYKKLEKENPTELSRIQRETPELFNQMYNEAYVSTK